MLSSVGIVTFLLPSNVVPIPTPITSPSISICLGVVNLFAVSTVAAPKSILTLEAEVILPLASTVTIPTWVAEP